MATNNQARSAPGRCGVTAGFGRELPVLVLVDRVNPQGQNNNCRTRSGHRQRSKPPPVCCWAWCSDFRACFCSSAIVVVGCVVRGGQFEIFSWDADIGGRICLPCQILCLHMHATQMSVNQLKCSTAKVCYSMEDVHAPHGVVNTNQALWLWLGSMNGASGGSTAHQRTHTSRQTALLVWVGSKYASKFINPT